jgi:hypothetical protein
VKVRVFDASDGDCLLLSSAGNKPVHVLVDGGRTKSFVAHTRKLLAELDKLDVAMVSHIDDDHITGVLRLAEDEVAWRAFEFHKTIVVKPKKPAFPKPPPIGEVWHNGLFRMVGDDIAPQVEEVLSVASTVLAGSSDADMRGLASQLGDLATGEKASMELTRRLSTEQLGIPLNPDVDDGGLMTTDKVGVLERGKLRFHLLGPSQKQIDDLGEKWRAWLGKSKKVLRTLQAQMVADEERLGTPAIDAALGDGLSGVTEANVASLMFLVEEQGGGTALLTGDGVSDAILSGLRLRKKLDQAGRIHVGVLKVQHHGATGNVTEEFVNSVTADHYVFCGNGASRNPELEVVESFALARSKGIGAGRVGPRKPFKLWFTSSSKTPGLTDARKSHMKQVEALLDRLAAADPKMSFELLAKGGSFEITP